MPIPKEMAKIIENMVKLNKKLAKLQLDGQKIHSSISFTMGVEQFLEKVSAGFYMWQK